MTNKTKTPAQFIKEELKTAFPWVKFSCKYSTFSMWDSVDVSWKWWPTESEVEKIALQYQAWYFDWMTDMYEYTNDKPYYMTAKYVSCKRENDDDEIEKWINEYSIDKDKIWNMYNIFDNICDVRYHMANGIKNRLNNNTKNRWVSFDEELNKRHKEMWDIIASYIVNLKYH